MVHEVVDPSIASDPNQRTTVMFNCGVCNAVVSIDVTDYHRKATVTDIYTCQNGHSATISIREGKIISRMTQKTSDIEEYPDVPDYIKEIVTEAYTCSGLKVPKAGASLVRLLLDDLLYELGFTQGMCGNKVAALDNRCRNDAGFRQNHGTLCRRVSLFRTIGSLCGFHVHAQGRPITEVIQTEFDGYLVAVEGAVKERWPRRNP